MENGCISFSHMSELWLCSQVWILPLNGIHPRTGHCCFSFCRPTWQLEAAQKWAQSCDTEVLFHEPEPFQLQMKMFRRLEKPATLDGFWHPRHSGAVGHLDILAALNTALKGKVPLNHQSGVESCKWESRLSPECWCSVLKWEKPGWLLDISHLVVLLL